VKDQTIRILFVLLAVIVSRYAISAEPCGKPKLAVGRPGDAVDDAAGRGQIFESIVVPGFTDVYVDTSGIAIADLDRDGLLDILVIYSGYRTDSHTLKLLLNRGCLHFKEHPVQITGSEISADALGGGVQIPNLVDFNNDGFPDLLLTRSGLKSSGNTLLLSDGSFDRFVDRSKDLDLQNLTSYTRQSSIADVNGIGATLSKHSVARRRERNNAKNAKGGTHLSQVMISDTHSTHAFHRTHRCCPYAVAA